MAYSPGFIAQCEEEKLHLSGAIQPHGVLLVCDRQGRLSHVSANAAEWLGEKATPAALLGQPLPHFLREVDAGAAPLNAGEHYLGQSHVSAQEFDVVISDNGEQRLFELYPVIAHAKALMAPVATQPIPRDSAELDAQCQQLLETLREMSGYDRVLYYRFLPEGDGEVQGEVLREASMGRYRGLRFPASDIPQVARELYLANPWRAIPDAKAEPVPIVSREEDAVPNLSWVDLRSVSPVHQEYMANMGVGAAVSLPIVFGGELDALISCHAATPRPLTVSQLSAMREELDAFNLRLRDFKARRRLQIFEGLQHHFGQAQTVLKHHGSIEKAWPELSQWLLETFNADGVVLQIGTTYYTQGSVLPKEGIAAVDARIRQEGRSLWLSDRLSYDCPNLPLTSVAGVAVVRDLPLDPHETAHLYLCREEYIYQVTWGGNPDKPADYRQGGRGIAPRRSFEAWVEQRLGHSRPWSKNIQLYLLKLRALLQQAKRHLEEERDSGSG
ncbi:GAF domain-containing protein [Vreelandella massiliensis]|uniref:GAF domain-containing protein n=1 Tax=Vreelandella massiliensis TaxID=1816686 RepID=UPI00096AC8F8|nr:GAF domain-containing protein [Halomonas massiliensis]